MKLSRGTLLSIGSLLLFTAAAAHAFPVATLSCTKYAPAPGSSPAQPTSGVDDAAAKVSFFSIGVTNTGTAGSQSSGAGAGKVTFRTADIHVALSKFPEFFQAASTGGAFTSCSLVTTLNDGNSITYDMKLVFVQSVTAIASSARHPADVPAAYTDLILEYGAVQVTTKSGSDDGGTGGLTGGSGSQPGSEGSQPSGV